MIEIKINTDELKKAKLFVGCPMYGGLCSGMFARSTADLAAMCASYGLQLQLYYLFNESLITRARNYIADEFMRSEATHLMFIDADIGFDARDVIALLTLSIQRPEYDIIGGPYPKKCISWEKVKQAVDKGLGDKDPNNLDKYIGDFVFNPKQGTERIPLGEPCEVLEVGTGFMMIRKETFQRFLQNYGQYHYRPDHVRTAHFDGSREIMQYFQAEIDVVDRTVRYKAILDKLLNGTDPNMTDLDYAKHIIKTDMAAIEAEAAKDSKRYLSEDYWFTQKCQKIGLRTWLCPWMQLKHMGTYVFGGSLIDLAQAGASATADVNLLKKPGEKPKKTLQTLVMK